MRTYVGGRAVGRTTGTLGITTLGIMTLGITMREAARLRLHHRPHRGVDIITTDIHHLPITEVRRRTEVHRRTEVRRRRITTEDRRRLATRLLRIVVHLRR